MIEVCHLTKRYGRHCAVNDLSFSVKEGEILGFLGPNGAGKTTTMNILTGYLSATEGTVTIDGYDILESPKEAKRRIGYLPEVPPLYPDMTVQEYLSFIFDLKKVKLPKKEHLQEVCRLTRIDEVAGRLIAHLSKGYRQRVGIAQALLGNPPVLILDEPTVGLDPKQIIEIRDLIRELGEKHTVILSSHILPEVQATCERILIIHEGRLAADGTPDSLSAAMREDNRLTARIEGNEPEITALIGALEDVKTVRCLGEKEPGACDYLIEPEDGEDVRRSLFAALSNGNHPLLSLASHAPTLEDVFLKLTGDSVTETVLKGDDAAF